MFLMNLKYIKEYIFFYDKFMITLLLMINDFFISLDLRYWFYGQNLFGFGKPNKMIDPFEKNI